MSFSFTTVSSMSHATMLTDGRMELDGNFDQGGDIASFGSCGNFTIAFMRAGEHKVHFDNIEYSRFANIDPLHANVVMDDEPIVAAGRLLYSISKGAVSGLQEALSIEDLNKTAVDFMSFFGISIAAGALIDAPIVIDVLGVLASVIAVISSFFMAAQAVEGIYSTATGTGTSYQKAENYAHDAVLLILSAGAIAGSAVEFVKNVDNLQSALNTLKGREDRFRSEKVFDNAQ